MPNKHHMPRDLLDMDFVRPSELGCRPWSYWRFWRRGEHRNGALTVLELQLEDFHSRDLIKLTKAKEARLRACAEAKGSWHATPDGKHYCFHGIMAFPKVDVDEDFDVDERKFVMTIDVPKGMTSIPALSCLHENREVNVETSDMYWGNSIVGTDIIDETTHCTDCGVEIFPLPMLYDRKQGWHNDE